VTDQPDLPDEPDDLVEDDHFEDFDAYWAQQEARRRPVWTRIHGVEVEAPTDIPLEFEVRATQMADAENLDDLRGPVGMLLGDGVVDDLIAAGVGIREMQLLLVWAQANGSGLRTTLAEAAELVAKAQAGAVGPGKADNRAARRAQTRTVRRSGGRSAPTGR
jgi:hypothetical protein